MLARVKTDHGYRYRMTDMPQPRPVLGPCYCGRTVLTALATTREEDSIDTTTGEVTGVKVPTYTFLCPPRTPIRGERHVCKGIQGGA